VNSARATLAELEGLLGRLPGVSVVSTETPPGHLTIIMRIEQIESLGPIVYCTDGANVHFDIWSTAPGESLKERTNPTHLRYRVTAKDSKDRPNGALDDMQFFAVYLVWYLHAAGALDTTQANRLLANWDGQLVTSAKPKYR
jgi:hypothetical protein